LIVRQAHRLFISLLHAVRSVDDSDLFIDAQTRLARLQSFRFDLFDRRAIGFDFSSRIVGAMSKNLAVLISSTCRSRTFGIRFEG
jgi:hypothetical protein